MHIALSRLTPQYVWHGNEQRIGFSTSRGQTWKISQNRYIRLSPASSIALDPPVSPCAPLHLILICSTVVPLTSPAELS
jgi:hypothetical protein